MPTNVEIKARLRDPLRAGLIARQLSGTDAREICQKDTFFECSTGRLKLREFFDDSGELIFYLRTNVAGTKQSDYSIVPTDSPRLLVSLLSGALGVRAVISKRRSLYIVGQTRVHVDEVDGLGAFLELEVVLKEGQSVEEGHAIAKELMRKLEILDSDLIEGSYADLQNQMHGA